MIPKQGFSLKCGIAEHRGFFTLDHLVLPHRTHATLRFLDMFSPRNVSFLWLL